MGLPSKPPCSTSQESGLDIHLCPERSSKVVEDLYCPSKYGVRSYIIQFMLKDDNQLEMAAEFPDCKDLSDVR